METYVHQTKTPFIFQYFVYLLQTLERVWHIMDNIIDEDHVELSFPLFRQILTIAHYEINIGKSFLGLGQVG